MVVEGRGNNRGEGLGIGHVLGEMGACLDTGVKGVMGTMRGLEGGVVMGGRGERNAGGHTGDEKTTKRWETDDRARDRLK